MLRPLRLAAALSCLALLPWLVAPSTATSASGLSAARAASTGLTSTFDNGAEGWVTAEAGDQVAWVSVGGHPGGAMSVQRGTGGATGLRSPASWAGSRPELFGGRLTFDVKLGPGVSTPFFEVYLASSTGSDDSLFTQIQGLEGEVPGWTRVTVPLTDNGLWYRNGQPNPAGPAEFDTALSHFSYLSIAASTQDDSDTMYLDNVVLASKVKRSMTLALKGGRFFGKVKPSGACAKKQAVTVFRTLPGPDDTVGKTRTDGAGEFALRARNPKKGTYYAQVKAGFAAGGGDCSAAKSKGVKVR